MTRAPAGGPIDLDEAVGFIVYRAHQALRQDMYRRFAELGVEMTPEQWIVLVRLWERDGRTQTELAEQTLRDKHTMSRMLDGMEQRGWLERRPDPDDGRSRRVHLTRKGRALEARLVPLAREVTAKVLRGIAADELAVALHVLRRMSENAGAPE